MKKQAIFIDRNTILLKENIVRGVQVNPLTMSEFKIDSKAKGPIAALKRKGYILIAITHQPGISDGTQSKRSLEMMHTALQRHFSLDSVLVCPHQAADDCQCLVPKPGLFVRAYAKSGIHLEHSFLLSRRSEDAEAAEVFHTAPVLIDSPWIYEAHKSLVVPDLLSAMLRIPEALKPTAADEEKEAFMSDWKKL